MTDLIERMDRFVTGMMDEAEGCGATPSNDTSESEDTPAPPTVAALSERVALLKACTAYLELRDRLTRDKSSGTKPKAEGEPEIVRFREALAAKERGRRR